MTVADTEYDITLPIHCVKFLIHTRDESSFRLAFVTGKVAGPAAPWFTVPSGSRYYEDSISNDLPIATRITLYFASADAGKIIEVITWR